MMLPLLGLFAIFLAYLTARTCTPRHNKERRKHIIESVSKVIIIMMLLIFPGLSTKVFSMFKCQSVNGIDQGKKIQSEKVLHVMEALYSFNINIFITCSFFQLVIFVIVSYFLYLKHPNKYFLTL